MHPIQRVTDKIMTVKDDVVINVVFVTDLRGNILS